MKVAVTGASGFLGRHVTAALLERGLKPLVATRDPASLAGLSGQAEIVKLDVHAPGADPFAALGCPDHLIHLAWQGLPHYRSLHHLDHELCAQMRFLERLAAAGLSGLSIAGTCLEYGMACGALAESAPAIPTTAYGIAKDTLRRYVQALAERHGFAWVWHRLFYLHGPGQAATSLLPQLERAVAEGQDCFPMSDGEQIRDFHPVATAAAEIVSLALKRQTFGVVNGCSGNPISVRRFVEHHMTAKDWKIRLDLGRFPHPDYEPLAFWGDRSYLNRCLAP